MTCLIPCSTRAEALPAAGAKITGISSGKKSPTLLFHIEPKVKTGEADE